MDQKGLEDFEMVSSTPASYVGEREVHVQDHLHVCGDRLVTVDPPVNVSAGSSGDPMVNVTASSSGSQVPFHPDMPANERNAVFGRVESGGVPVEQPLFMLKGSKVFHRKSCHHIRHYLPIEKDGRLRAYLPCVCINSLGRESYVIDGRVIHRQWCTRANSDGLCYTFCRKCLDRGA